MVRLKLLIVVMLVLILTTAMVTVQGGETQNGARCAQFVLAGEGQNGVTGESTTIGNGTVLPGGSIENGASGASNG